MFILERAAITNVILTLKEKSTLDNPTYLFEFVNDYSKFTIYFICADISTNKDRYNEFNITLVETLAEQNLLIGKILWVNSGYYSYTVYEQVSSTNLDPDNVTGIVETGKLKMVDPNENYIRQL